ncbi:protein aubergine [Fopius arisanus]|uniref:Piwi_2 protein n=2 Tax=Fopius arisanus TaxID=64838 RepID=A0A0C9RXH0_9HYME|nr:PREDICTED: protein aubergine-like [Fopius arisanus]
MEGKPIGRSRGRARCIPGDDKPAKAPRSAFGRPAGGPASVGALPAESVSLGQRGLPMSIGRSVRAPAPFHVPFKQGEVPEGPKSLPPLEVALPGPGGDGGGCVGRGSLRGRRIVSGEIINTRPEHVTLCKKGISGDVINLTTNYYKILEKPDWCLYQYRVDFKPEEDRTIARKGLLRQHRQALGSYIFDGTVLYTTNRLTAPDQNMVVHSQRLSDNCIIEITIRLVGDMTKGDPHYLQFYNILTRKCLESLNLQLVGRNYFDPQDKVEIREYQFELWPGYITSIRQHERDVLMCAEINHKIMRQETLLHILQDIRERSPGTYQNTFKSEVIGLTILTSYNNKTYRIDDVDFQQSPQSTFFSKKDNAQVMYMNYYSQRYGINIKVPTQPLLVTRSSGRDRRAGQDEIIYLVPELCRATGLTDKMRNDFRLMSALAQHTRVTPQRRIDKLLAFNRRLNSTPAIQEEFKNWNLTLDSQLVKLQGRHLPNENIHFGDAKFVQGGPEADWTKSIRDNSLFITNQLKQWIVVVPERSARDARSFVAGMVRSTKNFAISEPQYLEIRNDKSDSYTDCLEKILCKVSPQLVMCILTKNRADTYSAIKKKLCIDRPVPSQVVTARCFNPKGMMSIATKVAIQINCKIGGIPWTIHNPLGGVMVVGYDACHDTNKRETDFGAMVASLDRKLSRYFSAVSAHKSGEELSSHFAANMVKALEKYKQVNNGALPSHIIVYRDGVGEGQVPFVVDHEVSHVEEAITKFYNNVQPVKLGYIVVTKRINTRFFQGTRNPLPGTVVDDVVTNPMKYDFFLISQSVKQGTVAPTSYSVIYDSLQLTPDKLQLLTYKMTHLYFNCSTTMRVPAPVQFAHKLAFLVSQSIHAAPTNDHLASLLYFL